MSLAKFQDALAQSGYINLPQKTIEFLSQKVQNERFSFQQIRSPRVPSVEEMVAQIRALLEVFPKEQLWINPDCGLKTRKWEEVKPALANMVEAVKTVRG